MYCRFVASFQCIRCEYGWKSRKPSPKKCPGCQSPLWNTPRKRKKSAVGLAAVSIDAGTAVGDGADLEAVAVPVPVLDRVAEARKKAMELLEKIS